LDENIMRASQRDRAGRMRILPLRANFPAIALLYAVDGA